MNYRKILKRNAKHSLKEHYGIWVILCLLMVVISGDRLLSYSMTMQRTGVESRLEEADPDIGVAITSLSDMTEKFTRILMSIGQGNKEEERKQADENLRKQIEESKENKTQVLGRSRGVLSGIVNRITSGSFIVSLAVGTSSIIGSDSIAAAILIVISLLVFLSIWFFLLNTYVVVMARMFLEGQRYEVVHIHRVLFLLKTKKWVQTSITMFLVKLFETLWWLTIIGGVIKHYSYFMVPYIVAENPEIKPLEAINLSRKIMNGHKWECFVLEISFIGWEILGALTAGAVNILFTRPYKEAVCCEYYTYLRRLGKKNDLAGIELLNDVYLFEMPEKQKLELAYQDIIYEEEEVKKQAVQLTGIYKILAEWFGLTIYNGKKEKEFEKVQTKFLSLVNSREELEGRVYPTRLSAIPEKKKRQAIVEANYLRCYSIWSVIMIFFIMSFGGWLWEVGLHLISDGEFVNRGVLLGPWLPIYGVGSTLMLLILYRLRKNPFAEFIMIMVLAGVVEYFTSYFMEQLYDGKKWWDYTGYFLNLNGRICAEGLLVFGVGGMVIIYFLAPLLDKFIRRLPFKTVIVTSVILIGLFGADCLYSGKHPNEGKGITSYGMHSEQAQNL